ncbi:MAG TPA: DUF1553 domain-containing protein [Verrucomicrobiae bacterium]
MTLIQIIPLVAAAVAASDLSRLPSPAPRPVDFARDIQPIFEKSCYSCHGPEKQKGELRLDQKAAALKGGDTHAPDIIPGKSAESPLIHFVAGLVPDMKMPAKGESLTTEQIGLLRAWIDQGAIWPEANIAASPLKTHWSFQPLTRPPAPKLSLSTSRATQPIDSFILAKLTEKSLSFSPEGDRRTLIRRVCFDVIGLPPSPEEVEAFVADKDPKAYEKLVDRLLASPRYGERWARHWLDVVRFAESDGFEKNNMRANAWPYRDYVIKAFNDDLPYDRFIREQLAGDAVGADVATSFLVGGAVDRVKSKDPVLTANQRADELHDMVTVTGATFLGLTVNCARCHNHKFDPISAEDYYSIAAMLQGVQHGERAMRPSDDAEHTPKRETLRKELAPIEQKLSKFQPRAQLGRVVLIDDAAPQSTADKPGVTQIEQPKNGQPISYSEGKERGQASDPGDLSRLPNLGESYRYWSAGPDKREDFFTWDPHLSGKFRIWLSWGAWTTHAKDARHVLDRDGNLGTTNDQTEIAVVDQSKFADGAPAIPQQKRWSSFRLAGVHDLTSESRLILRNGNKGGPTVADAVVFEEVADVTTANEKPALPALRAPVSHRANEEVFDEVEAKFVRFTITSASSAEPCIDELEVISASSKPRNVALESAGTKATVSGTYANGNNSKHRREHVNDGRYGNDHSWISSEKGAGWVQLEFAKPERINRVVWSRDRGDAKKGKVYDDRLAIGYRIEVSPDGKSWRAVASSTDRLPADFRKRVPLIPTLSKVPASEAAEVAKLTARRAKLLNELQELSASPLVYAGRFEQPGPTYRMHRGDPMQPREAIAPGALAEFGAKLNLPADAPDQERRLALADWIADPKHPLTARVIVNRLWHYHFGAGIVDTPSDFGINGGKPTHPELLDWLASELVASGWRLKHIHRLILLSATYRQSSAPNAAALKLDANARFLWRFPPRRLEAEPLRDAMLAISGKLDLRMGGPGFDLFEPNDNYVKVFTTRAEYGPAEFRRMVYQSKPRTMLDDVFGAFDCPDAGQSAPKRTSSTTPLQALNLLNSPFATQQAGYLAERLEKDAGKDVAAQVRRAFQLVFSRAPSADEAIAATKLVTEHGLKVFCRALFNSNEFINVF